MRNFYHLWTPDNHQIILTCESNFKMAMNIFALSAALSPEIVILTFELMDNHLHVTLNGTEKDARDFFALYKSHLGKWLRSINRATDLSGFECKLRQLETAQDVRNVLSYNNRNGFLVSPDDTPFSYRWGAGRFFFNPDARIRYENEAVKMTMTQRRVILHSHNADKIDHLKMLDGYVCPLSFCDIDSAERYYRNAANYFYEISRNIESQKAIAQEIGERIMYTDDELYRITVMLSNKQYDQNSPSLLSQSAKTEVARQLHFEWGASKKQICRLLKIPIIVLNSIFQTPQ